MVKTIRKFYFNGAREKEGDINRSRDKKNRKRTRGRNVI